MTKVDKRRRREGKTNYSQRIKILKGEKPRVIFRKTNRYLIAQYVTSKESQDKIEEGVNTKDLLNYGWPKEASGSLKSISAAYLLGILLGKRMEDKKDAIIDFGMIRNIHKSRAYAFLKALLDSGIKMNPPEGIFPAENRIKGEHMKNKIPFEAIKSKILADKKDLKKKENRK